MRQTGIWAGDTGSPWVMNNLVHDNPGAIGIHLPRPATNRPVVVFNTFVCNDTGISGEGRVWYNIFWNNRRGEPEPRC